MCTHLLAAGKSLCFYIHCCSTYYNKKPGVYPVFGSEAASSLLLYPAEIFIAFGQRSLWESHHLHDHFLKPQHISPDV